ncbi:hypothetical protein [Micromonospora aurantiaca (nom. illeg.)]|uniref:hypothetical protein n=1 Tax=Micromonospora aurantiaca (nom. illeg.) TaxID=47850 RepID=UPI0037B622E9
MATTDLAGRAAKGEVVDLAPADVFDVATMSWDGSRAVPAEAIRQILIGGQQPKTDPLGLRIRGACVSGRLDLDNVRSEVSLELTDCYLPAGLAARNASLPAVTLANCRVEGGNSPALDLAGGHLDKGLTVVRCLVLADAWCGAMTMDGLHVGGDLDCRHTTVQNPAGPALAADDLTGDRSVLLGPGFSAEGAGRRGAIRLTASQIGAHLLCTGTGVRNTTEGPALAANGITVGQDISLCGRVEGSGEAGAIRLMGAYIKGQLRSQDISVCNPTGPAVSADGLVVDQDVKLRGVFEGARGDGAMRFAGVTVGGTFDCRRTVVRNHSGPALIGDRLNVRQDVFLDFGFTAEADSAVGAVRLTGGEIGGELCCSGATLRNATGAALHADLLTVRHGALFGSRFRAVGAGPDGAIRMAGARVAAVVDFRGAALLNESGPALVADWLTAEQGLSLGHGFVAKGAGEKGVVSLVGGRIRLQWGVHLAQIRNTTRPGALLSLDQLTYDGIPVGMPFNDLLTMVRHRMTTYSPQPYQQLASVYQAAGQDREARTILMAQRTDQVRSGALTSRAARTWVRFTGVTLGYGYQPWRALVGLALAATVAVLICVTSTGALAHTHGTAAPGSPCSLPERIGVALDMTGPPLVKTGTRSVCDVSATGAGGRLMMAGWALQLLAWAFGSLFIAGFTSAVRKT